MQLVMVPGGAGCTKSFNSLTHNLCYSVQSALKEVHFPTLYLCISYDVRVKYQ
jgi:hypothetical protein